MIDKLSQAIRQQYPDKKGCSRRNIFYMCQFAAAYPLKALEEMDRIDSLLETTVVESVLSLTTELNQIVQEPLALIQSTDNQSNGITQHPVAQLEKVPETLTAIYHYDIGQIEEFSSVQPLFGRIGQAMSFCLTPNCPWASVVGISRKR